MSAHTLGTVLDSHVNFGVKYAVVEVALSASYDAGGSVIDMSSVFPSKLYGMQPLAVTPHGSAKYHMVFKPGTSYATSTTSKIKIHDVTASSGAEASGDLSATTVTFLAFGK